MQNIKLEKNPLSIAVDSKEHLVAYSLDDGTIKIYDIVNKNEVQKISGAPSSNPILQYSPNKSFLASTQGDINKISN